MGRIHDIVKTLFGRSEPQIELAKMRADFADLMLDVSNAMEKLKTAALKFAKRDTRAMGEALEPDLSAAPLESSKWTRRAAVMARRQKPIPMPTEEADVGSDQASTG